MQAPFVMFDPKSGYITGIDVLLLKTIAKKLNLQLELRIVNNLTANAESLWEYVLLTTKFIIFSKIPSFDMFYQISSTQEIIDTNLRLAGDSNVLSHLEFRNLVPENEIRSFEVCDDIEKCLKRLTFDDSLAVATSQRYLESLNIRRDIFCFDTSQNIYSYLRKFLIHTDFKLKDSCNNAVKWIMEAGLIARWKKDFSFKRDIDIENAEVHSVNIEDLLGALILFGGFFMLAIIVAGIEQITFRKAHFGNPKSFWKWMSMMIDGDRHFLLYDSAYGSKGNMKN
ncbi:uncharacterized protein LOC129567020 [Sitodiplosis mosellana]|uniref:uncharacterized protein LOC129567020 n=1 Tax=Sitodiplosis mosellana TaxID=263140 RepID=UPI0024438AB4|nr:uncharacterized protein LOC129567020 [Sitodiplosis mosellana]